MRQYELSYLFCIYCIYSDLHSDPHSIPIDGDNAPNRCLPNANKPQGRRRIVGEESIQPPLSSMEVTTENVDVESGNTSDPEEGSCSDNDFEPSKLGTKE